jgi:exodeoxyribonuclease VII small subunit
LAAGPGSASAGISGGYLELAVADPVNPVNPEELSFDAALKQLEDRVRDLERGDVPLERALALYEEGVKLVRTCHEKLDAADKRIVELSGEPSGTRPD